MDETKKYIDFGGQLKKLRLSAKKTINDVSGAVELSADKLKQIEMGTIRPREDLIFLLANYFDLTKPQTQYLLRLAGYNRKNSRGHHHSNGLQAFIEQLLGQKLTDSQQILFAISEQPTDERAVYTDKTTVNVSHSGVVIEFLQNATMNRSKQMRTVAKVGMSVEHAHQLLDILRKTLTDLNSSGNPNVGGQSKP